MESPLNAPAEAVSVPPRWCHDCLAGVVEIDCLPLVRRGAGEEEGMKVYFPLNPYNQQRQYEKPAWVYPAHLAMYATALHHQGNDIQWGGDAKGSYDHIVQDDFAIDIPFDQLPYPDRILTDAKHPRWQSYGNYKRKPATHMMASNLCWYGKCTFCIDTWKLEHGEARGVRSVAHVMAEIDDLIAQGYREVFDDSGTFPVGAWLEEFCRAMQSRKRHITIGCNMKPVTLNYQMMADAGFRFILVGIESANQETVNRIKKGQRSEDIIPIIKSMSDAGLEPHGTFMSAYPFETFEEEKKTIKLCHYLLRKGYLKTAQVSVYSPPRTAPDPLSEGHKRIPLYFNVYKSPEFWYRKIVDTRSLDDIKYLFRGARLVAEEYYRKLWKAR